MKTRDEALRIARLEAREARELNEAREAKLAKEAEEASYAAAASSRKTKTVGGSSNRQPVRQMSVGRTVSGRSVPPSSRGRKYNE